MATVDVVCDQMSSGAGRFKPRKKTDFQRDFNLHIYAVGKNVETALKALGASLKWGKVYNIEFQEVDTPCNWYVYFKVGKGGTGMKAAGEYVTGGVIVTWWK